MYIKSYIKPPLLFPTVFAAFLVIVVVGLGIYILNLQKAKETNEKNLRIELAKTEKALKDLQSQDQVVINKTLEEEIKNIQTTYKKSLISFEQLTDLKAQNQKTAPLDALFAEILNLLSQRKYASAESSLASLNIQISQLQNKLAASTGKIPTNVTTNNSPPSNTYNRQYVKTDIGTYLVDIIGADLGSTRVIVDTASDTTCTNNCPVLSLGDYVGRNGAYAGINGSYFCPADYPSCAGKSNSFDTLLMNKNKVYFNSENNVYSTVPAVIFLGGSVRFVGRSLDWGRDTGIDSMIANQPLLVSGGQSVFGGDSDPKKGSRGPRSFVANKGNTVYIGIVQNATVAEAAKVLQSMGMDNALNLDSGGSTALWFGGYKAGPGRNIPNAILFVRK